MRGAQVGNLQIALKEQLGARMLGAQDDAAREELVAALEPRELLESFEVTSEGRGVSGAPL